MIAIKGMEMPTSCKECMLNNVDSPWFGLCRTTGNNVIEYKDSRHPDCPLVEIVTCKDCKHWKDSDGVYRRGIGAENKCPVNSSRVFKGTFYCADFVMRGESDGRN
jgi:hypothetical protein